MREYALDTRARSQVVDVTSRVREAVAESGVRSGIDLVFVPHTTAGVTINENADPDVKADLLRELDWFCEFDGPRRRTFRVQVVDA
ncbi:MAG: YjbQ family protein [Planctomycetes bacterium]|nr:YjbQ family protein [Planctomycetota bacterium]